MSRWGEASRKFINDRNGFTTTFFAMLLPVLIIFIGLCVDGGNIIYNKILLQQSTDSAALATIDAYDRNAWFNEGVISLREDVAWELADQILRGNMASAQLVDVAIDPDSPHISRIESTAQIQLMFTSIFGIESHTLFATSTAHGTQ